MGRASRFSAKSIRLIQSGVLESAARAPTGCPTSPQHQDTQMSGAGVNDGAGNPPGEEHLFLLEGHRPSTPAIRDHSNTGKLSTKVSVPPIS